MLVGIAREITPSIARCELTFINREAINHALAVQQYNDYCRFLRECGVKLKVLPGDTACPDCCFVEDTAVVVDEVAVVTSMGSVARRGEVTVIRKELSRHRETTMIEFPALIEGGDVLRVGRNIFV